MSFKLGVKKRISFIKTFLTYTDNEKRKYNKNVKLLEKLIQKNASVEKVGKLLPESFLNKYFEENKIK